MTHIAAYQILPNPLPFVECRPLQYRSEKQGSIFLSIDRTHFSHFHAEVLESWKKVENAVVSISSVGLSVDNEAIRDAQVLASIIELVEKTRTRAFQSVAVRFEVSFLLGCKVLNLVG